MLDLQSGADDSSAPLSRSMDSSYPPHGADEKITENISYRGNHLLNLRRRPIRTGKLSLVIFFLAHNITCM